MVVTKYYSLFILLITLACLSSCNSFKNNEEFLILAETSLGKFKVKLYNETPLHRDNFMNLVNRKFYEDLSFHRVINHFMIQSGDFTTRQNIKNSSVDSVITDYTIPAEFHPHLFHKKGALAAARKGDNINPNKESSCCQFYIVHGNILNDDQLDQLEQEINNTKKQSIFLKNINLEKEKALGKDEPIDYPKIQEAATLKTEEEFNKLLPYKISEYNRSVYKSIGGTPHLDGSYTVFGEVVEGLDVINKIASVKTDDHDRPLKDVYIIKIKRVRK
jgi:peptidylprolyl isomerase